MAKRTKNPAAQSKNTAPKKRKLKSIPVFSVQNRNEARRALQDYIRTNDTTVQERNALRRKQQADFKAARNQE